MRESFTHATALLAAMALLATLLAGSIRAPHGMHTATAASLEGTHFSDGFESGDFSAWTLLDTGADAAATVESNAVASGRNAARLSATSASGSYAYARKTLATAQTDLDAAGDFDVSA